METDKSGFERELTKECVGEWVHKKGFWKKDYGEGYKEGYKIGYKEGYKEGCKEGYKEGCKEGYKEGCK
ncbi:MAG: hypothetical protein HGA22_09730 [Clostridiales bacterium]|nr:hypothetical protein [Clostridiales bacterium]